jgi:hypothetical protein
VLLQYLGGGVVYLLDVLYIEDNLVHRPALAANRIGGPTQYVRSTSGDYDPPALFRKAGRTCQSDAGSPSGDPRNAPRSTVHDDLPICLAAEPATRTIVWKTAPPKKIATDMI